MINNNNNCNADCENSVSASQIDRKKKYSKVVIANLITLLAVVLIWYLLSYWTSQYRNITFPTPAQTLDRLIKLLQGQLLYEHTIYSHLAGSFSRWVAGYLIAVVSGLVLGVICGLSRLAHRIIMPIVYVVQLIPGLAWIPVALLLFGIGSKATIFMIAVTALAPIIINVAGGIREVPAIYVKAARMMGATQFRIFYSVIIPASVIPVINGLRIGLANGWRVLIAAEMIVGMGLGLGYSIIQSRWSLDFEAAFVSIIVICAVGLFIEKVVFGAIERKVVYRMGMWKND